MRSCTGSWHATPQRLRGFVSVCYDHCFCLTKNDFAHSHLFNIFLSPPAWAKTAPTPLNYRHCLFAWMKTNTTADLRFAHLVFWHSPATAVGTMPPLILSICTSNNSFIFALFCPAAAICSVATSLRFRPLLRVRNITTLTADFTPDFYCTCRPLTRQSSRVGTALCCTVLKTDYLDFSQVLAAPDTICFLRFSPRMDLHAALHRHDCHVGDCSRPQCTGTGRYR